MLDLKFVVDNIEEVQKNCLNKNTPVEELDKVVPLDEKRRALIQQTDALKHERNKVSQQISVLKKTGENADAMIEEMRVVGDKIKALDDELRYVEHQLHNILLWIPNIAHSSVPLGSTIEDNVVVRTHGECADRAHRVDHLEISAKLGVLDFERGAKVTGSGFGFYVGKGAKLERALINYFLDTNVGRHGYTEIMSPFVANAASLLGTAQLPKSAEDMYFVEKDDLYLIPTAEVTITNFHRDEILAGEDLPIKYAGYSACFRREAGSHGKDTRGFLRVHQFNKVELVKFTRPHESYNELELLVANVEHLIKELGLTYRVLSLCSGDMTFGGAKTYDIEVWAPYEQKWLEVSSCTNFESFQARRANIRYKDTPSSKPDFVHTLNGSGIATSRIMVALLEQYQSETGGVDLPECLHSYCGFTTL